MSPNIYETMIKLRHGNERMKTIGKFLNGKKVIELGCATGYNSEYLDCDYRGFDMNKAFVAYGKNKGRNIAVGNVFDVPLANYDAILIVDVLHHVVDHKGLLKKALATGKQVIVCEPFERDFNNRAIEWLFDKVNKWIDSDGINPPVDWYKKKKLRTFFRSFGPCELYEIGEDVIAYYNKDKKKKK